MLVRTSFRCKFNKTFEIPQFLGFLLNLKTFKGLLFFRNEQNR